MINAIVSVAMTVVMAWGTFTNPVVSEARCRVSDPFTGEIIQEWREETHWNGQVDVIEVGP